MYTVSDIITDIDRSCLSNNMIEDYFTYRLVYFVNSENGNKKYYVDASYGNLRAALETVIRKNLKTTNCLVVAAVTTLKNGKCISLLSRSYPFSLDGYFKQIVGKKEKEYISNNYGRRRAQWC